MIDIKNINSAIEGDVASFEKLYDAISLELYHFAFYTLGNSHDAEDAVSETFVEAIKGIKNLRMAENFKSWMFKILSARCKRKIAVYVKERKNIDVDEMLDATSYYEELDHIDNLMLQKALKAISFEERQLVVLATIQGYTTKEIAKMLDMPQGTVSSKLHRTLKKMKSMME